MRLRRLANMGLSEILGRSRQQASRWADRVTPALRARRTSDSGLAASADGSLDAVAALDLFRFAAPRRFFPGVEGGEAADLLRERLPSAFREVLATATAANDRRVDLLGHDGLALGDAIDWHLDPIAGRRAPSVHWSRINALNPAMVGDSKVVWELSRHQWLLAPAQAYWLTADRRYAQEVADVVDDWSRANPYGIGINWTSSLEVALRLVSWSWLFVLIRDAGVLSPREFSGLVGQIRTHGQHVERYLSRYFAPNTHLTGEALGLFYVGVLFPELAEASRWRRLGWQILVEESRRQVLDDGVYFEQATCYQQYTVEIYLHFLILAARNNLAVPRDVAERVSRMVEFLLAVSGPDGSVPQIGDADGGWLLPLVRRAPGDCRGTFALAAAFFGRADFLWAAGGPTPEVLWLLGAAGWRRLATLRSEVPTAPPSACFPDGGYCVMRSEWSADAHHMIVDVGPLAGPLSAHAHADLLSIQCGAFGERYIVDPGTYCYTADATWRDHFRCTSAHSTVIVDGRSQAEPRGPFAWSRVPTTVLRKWTTTSALDLVDASHDAYATSSDQVGHRRRVLFVKPRYWLIVDDLSGRSVHDLELRFQFAPKPVDPGPGLWVVARGRAKRGLWLAPFSDIQLTRQVLTGTSTPREGWVSPNYGRRDPAPMVAYRARSVFPVRLVTLVVPVEGLTNVPPRVSVQKDSSNRLCGLQLEDFNECVRFDDDTVTVEGVREH